MPNASASSSNNFAEMDNAGVSKEHWKIMFISGMGFFTDAYELFIIGVVMSILTHLWHIGKVEESLVDSTALLASAIGALLFGRVADMLGRKRIYGVPETKGKSLEEIESEDVSPAEKLAKAA